MAFYSFNINRLLDALALPMTEMYFFSLYCQDNENLLGDVRNKKLKLNSTGKMLKHWYKKIETEFPNAKCYEMSIKPNYILCIIGAQELPLKAPTMKEVKHINLEAIGQKPAPEPIIKNINILGSPPNEAIKWFKEITTKHYLKELEKQKEQSPTDSLWKDNYDKEQITSLTQYKEIVKKF